MKILDNIPFLPNNINYSNNNSLRLKLTNSCSFSCNFCHHEGNAYSDNIIQTKSFFDFLHELQRTLVNEIHLTGGEPTLYPDLFQLIDTLNGMGFVLKMTTNGQFGNKVFSQLKEFHLNNINFSIHTLSPIKLSLIQNPHRRYEWGFSSLLRQLKNIEICRNNDIYTKINSVIQSKSELKDIIEFCKIQKIDLRILDDLSPNSISLPKIIDFLSTQNSKIIGLNVFNNSSSYSYVVQTEDNYTFKIKGIRKFILHSLCNKCYIRDKCKEWFYGIRMEQINGDVYIRLCIHRNDEPAILSIEKFLKSEQYFELIELKNYE